MKFRINWLLLAALFFVAPAIAHADGTAVNMVFTGVNGVNDGSYYVSPYLGTMNGNAVTLYCVDFNNDVTFGQTWQANVTQLASDNLSNTRYGGVADAQVLYEEAAWLSTQFAANPQSDWVAIQYAMWDLFDSNAPSTGAAYWLNLAALNYNPANDGNFEIVTNVGPVALTGQVQEFIVDTPEPATLLQLGVGVLALLFLARRKSLNSALQQNIA